MFKGWTWQMWIGKMILLAVAAVELLMKGLGFTVPWWTIILPAATWVAQFVLALGPKEAWQMVVGKLLLLAVSIVELALKELGVAVPLWALLMPMVMAFAQYLISLVPVAPATSTA